MNCVTLFLETLNENNSSASLHVFRTLNTSMEQSPKTNCEHEGKEKCTECYCQAEARLELQLHAHMTESRSNAVKTYNGK